ncbi:MAG: universal stress protein [Anaerolineae bacterium]
MLGRSQHEFTEILQRARWRRFLNRLLGREKALLPYEEVKQRIGLREQSYRGLQPVPLDRIVGSLGRSGDFDRIFRPIQRNLESKWVSVNSASSAGVRLPPISLYRVGDAYFVVDGHNRVSVARQQGQAFIDAEVIEVSSRVPVTADLTLDDLDSLAAYRAFLDETRLDILRPEQSVRLSMPGDYTRLREHIRTHKYFVETETSRELTPDEAVAHWYDYVYVPVIQEIRHSEMLRDFAGLTEADLYLSVIERGYLMSQELGRTLAPWEIARDFCLQYGTGLRCAVRRFLRRVHGWIVPRVLKGGPRAGAWRNERVEAAGEERLFHEILVTLTGAPSGWQALQQAAKIARLEGGALRGLHVLSDGSQESRKHGQAVLEEFLTRARDLGVPATGRMVQGEVVESILADARWSDLVVINQRREQGQVAERPLGTIFRAVTMRVARPILAVPGSAMPDLQRVVLAYDASVKSREALYVLRYMQSHWGVSAVILSVGEDGASDADLAAAEAYLREAGEIELKVCRETGPVDEAILRVVEREDAQMLLMGSYGYAPLIKVFVGSTVDRVLRLAWFPVIICK